MDKQKAKNLMKVAVALYAASFLIINWNDVSWMFNYKEVYGLVSDFFNPYPSISADSVNPYFYPNHTAGQAQAVANIKTNYTDKQSTLEVPKIDISVPIVFSDSKEVSQLEKDLDQGVVYYPGSVYPGQQGQIVILGHSAPPGWPKIKHDWVFTDLDKLSEGDKIYVDLNNQQYIYTVVKKSIINRGADVPNIQTALSNNTLALVSCWPPGKDYQRIAVLAQLTTN